MRGHCWESFLCLADFVLASVANLCAGRYVQSAAACTKHMRRLNQTYEGQVLVVNLIDMKKDQLALGEAYRTVVARANADGADVQYVCVCHASLVVVLL